MFEIYLFCVLIFHNRPAWRQGEKNRNVTSKLNKKVLCGSRILVFVVRVAGNWEVVFCPAVGNGVLADPSVSLKLVKRDSVCAFILQQSLNKINKMKR